MRNSNIDHYEDEIDRIRLELFEENKSLSTEEFTKKINQNAKRIADRYGLKVQGDSHLSA